MKTISLFVGLASITALVGTVAACSSTTTTTTQAPGDGGGVASEGGAAKDGGKDSSTTEETDSGTTTTDPDKACAQEATLQACGTCCVGNHPAGYKVFQDSLLACACAGTGAAGGPPCAAECAGTACQSPPAQPDQACNTCLQGSVDQNGACSDAVGTACSANADCLAQQKCITPCQSKPQQ